MSDARHLFADDEPSGIPPLFEEPAQPMSGPGPAQYVPAAIHRVQSGDGPAQWFETSEEI